MCVVLILHAGGAIIHIYFRHLHVLCIISYITTNLFQELFSAKTVWLLLQIKKHYYPVTDDVKYLSDPNFII